MKLVTFLALIFYSQTVDSQKVEFISGFNINTFYDLEENLRGSKRLPHMFNRLNA